MPMTADGLAKLIEECGELTQIAAKKLAYFHTDVHPDGKGSLKTRLEDEIADIRAAAGFVVVTMGLDSARIQERAKKKVETFMQWHRDPGNNGEGVEL